MIVLTLSELIVHVLDLLVFHEVSLRSHVVIRGLNLGRTNSRDTSCVLRRLGSNVIGRSPVPLIAS